MSERKVLAKLSGWDFSVEDHGCPTTCGCFEYEEGGVQGMGYIINVAFLMRLMAVFGVDRLQRINGRSCWVVFDDERNYGPGSDSSHIVRIEPLHKKEGKPFDIRAWQEWTKANCQHSAYELETGLRPAGAARRP